ncbi:MAG TPA: hypothetical protein VIN08_26990 [Ohtaekwangia sp.]
MKSLVSFLVLYFLLLLVSAALNRPQASDQKQVAHRALPAGNDLKQHRQ